ncbi:MAG TPA: ABC transporter ATP-binding protein [Rhodospirillaceae bacterium]|nr:MAG: hypothetical protein A2018_00970 [Alphaproteobacteria bacterium GWF2_58_20]HAU28607.1 ABC transporter ATP-binding protein [Rhodospirillaceae bacterium]
MTRRSRKIARTGANVALRLAGKKYLHLPTGSARHARNLTLLLGSLKGPVMKIGQFLATIPGLLPEDYAKALATLQTQAPPMGPHLVARGMQAALGKDWKARFADFEITPRFAASLGQVHLARGTDGKRLACKLQYPGMAEAVAGDVAQLRPTLRLIEKWSGALRLAPLAEEIANRLREECDYGREASAMRAFSALFTNGDGIAVPEPQDALCGPGLLTMSWLDGTSLAKGDVTGCADAALKLFRAFYKPFLTAGILHGDPHPGNYTLAEDGTLNLMDFGCIRIFPAPFVQGVVDLWRALMAGDEKAMDAAFALWGFEGLNEDARKAMRAWAAFLYEPLLDDRVRPIARETNAGLYGRDIAMATHQALKRAGGVSIPQEFVFIDRAALGLGSVFMALGAEANWHQAFASLAEGFDAKALARKQASICTICKL